MQEKMPWEIRELPYRDTTRKYVFWPDGVSRAATEEDLRIWSYVKEIEQRLADAEAKAKKTKGQQ